MRLIDADETIKYLREFMCKYCDRRKGMKNGKIQFCYEIGDAPCRACDIGDTIDYYLDEDVSPTIDAVPVVRCKDCKYCIKEPNKELYCDILAVEYEPLGSKKVNGDWFCADGERKPTQTNAKNNALDVR